LLGWQVGLSSRFWNGWSTLTPAMSGSTESLLHLEHVQMRSPCVCISSLLARPTVARRAVHGRLVRRRQWVGAHQSISSPDRPTKRRQWWLSYVLSLSRLEMSKWVVPVGRSVARHGFGPSRTRHGPLVRPGLGRCRGTPCRPEHGPVFLFYFPVHLFVY
jgi:hypothetical protein